VLLVVIAQLLQLIHSSLSGSSTSSNVASIELSLRVIALLCANKQATAQAAVLAADGIQILVDLAYNRLPYPQQPPDQQADASPAANANKLLMYSFWALSQVCTGNPDAIGRAVSARASADRTVALVDILLESLNTVYSSSIREYALATLLQLSIDADARRSMATHAVGSSATDRGLQLLMQQLACEHDALVQRSLRILTNLCVGNVERQALMDSGAAVEMFVRLVAQAPVASETAMNLVKLLNYMSICERDFDALYQVSGGDQASSDADDDSLPPCASSVSATAPPSIISTLLRLLAVDTAHSQFQPLIQESATNLLANLVSHRM
jgi:hypothetical protein